MTVRTVTRRGQRRLVVDICYRNSDGTLARYRHDAEVQTLQAARAEERRRLGLLATTGSPYGTLPGDSPPVVDEADEPDATAPLTAPLFRDVAKEYMAAYATSHLKPSTRASYKVTLDGFLLHEIGDEPITEITPTKVRELDAKLIEANAKPSTRRNHQIVLRSILCKFAIEKGHLAEAPAFPPLPKVGRKVGNALTLDEVTRLLDACTCRAQRRALALAAYAGLRAGEIRALRWKDIDLKAGTLTVRFNKCRGVVSTPKSGHERLIPLVDALRRELAGDGSKPEPAALVSRNALGKPWGEFTLRATFKRVCKRAGLSGWRFHDLRHFFVTALFRAGVPAPTVQALAGHADLSTTQRYAHTSRADLRAAMDRLGDAVRGNSAGNSVVTASE
jgi:integrase